MARVSMPTQNARLTFMINDFSGGLVNNMNDVKMSDNQSPDMLNMQFRNDGLLQKRPGTVFINNTPFGSELMDVIPYEYEPNTEVLMYLTPTMLCYLDGEDVKPVWENQGLYIKHVHFMGKLYFTDGFFLYYYNHNENTTYKIVNPPSDFTPAPKPAIVGEHKKKYIKALVNGASYYEIWYEPCQYEMEDGYNGANVIPPAIGCLATHKDRIYITGGDFSPNMVWISDILNPEYFPASLPIQTPPTNDVITALHTYNDNLIIGRRDTIFALFGNTNRSDSSEQYRLVEINCHTGMANYCSANQVFHMMFFVGSDGNFYKLNPPAVNADTLYTSQLNEKLDITLPPFNFTSDSVRNAISVFDSINNLWYIQLADTTLVYNYQLRAWTRYNNIDAVNFFKINNVVHFTRPTGSYYRFADKEANQQYYDEYYDPDAGVTINLPVSAYWSSRNMDMGIPARVKQFRDTYITSESFESYSTTINIRYEVDYTDIAQTYKIENEISKWDRAIFDVNKFVSRNIDRSLPLMINRRGRTLRVFFGCGYQYWGSFENLPAPGLVEEYFLVYVKSKGKLYVRVPRREGFENRDDKYYMPFPEEELNQALLVHNVMGIYELKGYR